MSRKNSENGLLIRELNGSGPPVVMKAL